MRHPDAATTQDSHILGRDPNAVRRQNRRTPEVERVEKGGRRLAVSLLGNPGFVFGLGQMDQNRHIVA